MTTQTFTDHPAFNRETARRVAAYINQNPGALLCLAAGDTPLGAFAELIKMQDAGEVNLSSVYYAGLDEWVGLGPHDKGSCRQVMDDHFYLPAKIPRERIHVFNGLADPAAECVAMNEWLALRGGIGLTLLGVGMNGHVGFNEPNGPDTNGAIIVELDDVTKSVGAKYFDKPQPVSRGITIGLATLRGAREILVMASGAKKSSIIQKAFFNPPTPSVPASMLQGHPNLTLLLDEAAAGREPTRFIVKRADTSDEFDQIAALNYATFVEEIPQHAQNETHRLQDKFHAKNTYFICKDNDTVAGMVSYCDQRPFSLDAKVENLDQHLPPNDSRICEIRLLSVRPEYRASKAAMLLLLAVFRHACENNVRLAVMSGTTRQLKMYRKLGFVPFGELVGTEGAQYQPMYITLEGVSKRPWLN